MSAPLDKIIASVAKLHGGERELRSKYQSYTEWLARQKEARRDQDQPQGGVDTQT